MTDPLTPQERGIPAVQRADVLMARARFRDERKRAEIAEAKVAELERERDQLKAALSKAYMRPKAIELEECQKALDAANQQTIDLSKQHGQINYELRDRLHQAQETLRVYQRVVESLLKFVPESDPRKPECVAMVERCGAALAGEDDDKPALPQREGDYL